MLLLLVLTGCVDSSLVEIHWFAQNLGPEAGDQEQNFILDLSLSQSQAAGCPVDGGPAASIEGMGDGAPFGYAKKSAVGCRDTAGWRWESGKGGGPYEMALPNAREVHLDFAAESTPELLAPPRGELLELGSEIQVQLPPDHEWGEITVEPYWHSYTGGLESCVLSWTEEDDVLTFPVREEPVSSSGISSGVCGDTITITYVDDALADSISRCDFDECRVLSSTSVMDLSYTLDQPDAP